jgi:dCMP deaminase
MAKKVILAYIPVVHQGYRKLIEDNPAYHSLYLLGKSITQRYRPLQKEIRALDPRLVRQLLAGWNLLDEIKVIELEELKQLSSTDLDILMPDEDISHDLRRRYLQTSTVAYAPTFLRWDRRRSEASSPVDSKATVTTSELHKALMRKANLEGLRSSDIWRRVGALVARDGQPLIAAHNQSRPTKYSVWLDGDPRNNFQKGASISMSTAQHAESCVISEAARKGVALEGSDMYVTTFPCPPCAMLIAYSGIKRLFFTDGYAILDGRRVLEANGVEIIRVQTTLKGSKSEAYLPYPD